MSMEYDLYYGYALLSLLKVKLIYKAYDYNIFSFIKVAYRLKYLLDG